MLGGSKPVNPTWKGEGILSNLLICGCSVHCLWSWKRRLDCHTCMRFCISIPVHIQNAFFFARRNVTYIKKESIVHSFLAEKSLSNIKTATRSSPPLFIIFLSRACHRYFTRSWATHLNLNRMLEEQASNSLKLVLSKILFGPNQLHRTDSVRISTKGVFRCIWNLV